MELEVGDNDILFPVESYGPLPEISMEKDGNTRNPANAKSLTSLAEGMTCRQVDCYWI